MTGRTLSKIRRKRGKAATTTITGSAHLSVTDGAEGVNGPGKKKIVHYTTFVPLRQNSASGGGLPSRRCKKKKKKKKASSYKA